MKKLWKWLNEPSLSLLNVAIVILFWGAVIPFVEGFGRGMGWWL